MSLLREFRRRPYRIFEAVRRSDRDGDGDLERPGGFGGLGDRLSAGGLTFAACTRTWFNMGFKLSSGGTEEPRFGGSTRKSGISTEGLRSEDDGRV